MEKFTLATDSCCDEYKSNLEKMNIPYLPLSYMEDEHVYYDDFSSAEDYKSFYDDLMTGRLYKTAGANPYDTEVMLQDLIDTRKKDVVFVSLSSGLSGSFNVVKGVAEKLNQTNQNKIYVVDSKSATQGQRIILNLARKFRDDGIDAERATQLLEEATKNLDVHFFVSDIDFLKRGGRINPLQAMFGKLMQLRPMLKFDEEGKLNVIDKIIGTKKAIRYLAQKCIERYDPTSGFAVYIAHTCNMESVYELKALLNKHFSDLNVIVGHIGPVVGSHTGPNALGILFFKKPYKVPNTKGETC